jgi:hypothetical protein
VEGKYAILQATRKARARDGGNESLCLSSIVVSNMVCPLF